MRFRFLCTVFLLIAPSVAAAAWEDVWDFRAQQVPGKWEVQGQTQAQVTPWTGGLRVTAPEGVQLMRETEFSRSYQVMEITTFSAENMEIQLLWPLSDSPNELVHLPVQILRSGEPKTQRIDLSAFPEWPGAPEQIALRAPPGADFVIQQIRFRGWNPMERLGSAIQSILVLDQYRPYTINFLWGPQMTFNPVARAQLWDNQPPLGRSVNGVLYGMLILGSLFLTYRYRTANGQRAAKSILLLVAVVWIAYDLRMGTELLNYVRHDMTTYITQPPSERVFRDRLDFYAFADQVSAVLREREQYVFLTPYRYPLGGLLRYTTYPALPVYADFADETITTWVVYGQPGITVENGRLLQDGVALPGTGSVILPWDEHAFVFRLHP